jgi:hypothetical protein
VTIGVKLINYSTIPLYVKLYHIDSQGEITDLGGSKVWKVVPDVPQYFLIDGSESRVQNSGVETIRVLVGRTEAFNHPDAKVFMISRSYYIAAKDIIMSIQDMSVSS